MKIIYITHSPEIQGGGIALYNIVTEISRRGHDVLVVLPGKGPLTDRLINNNIKCYDIMCYNTIYPRHKYLIDYFLYPYRLLRTLIVNYVAAIRFDNLVEQEKPDIIHTNSGVIRFGMHIAKKRNIPHVWHIREFQILDFGWKPLGGLNYVKKLYSSPHNRCIAITRSVYDFFCLSEQKDAIIYDGVFSEQVIGKHIAPKQNYLLYVGVVSKGKGVLELLDAFCEIPSEQTKIELWIAGSDELNIKKEIKTRNNPNIKYLGFVNNTYDLMANAKALIVPSFFEGFGFITAEAMLNNTVVIGRNVAGTKEQFDNGLILLKNEIGIRFNDKKDLVDKLKVFTTSDITAYNSMVENAHKTVRKLYTIETSVNKILELYNAIKK